MKIRLAIFFLFIGNFLCLAQNDSTKVAFIAYWSKGDSYDFLITKINKKWDGSQLVKNDSTSYFANFSVIDSTESEYKIQWKYKENFTNLPVEFGDLLNQNSVVLDFIYKTNEFGEFLEVENWQEIADLMKKSTDDLFNKLFVEKPGLDQTKLKNTVAPLINIYTSKEGIESLVLKELQYFHFPLGIEIETAQPLHYEEEFENLIGDQPLRGDAQINFETVDSEYGFCIFNQHIKINSDDAKNLVNQLFDTIGMNEAKFKELFKSSKFDITDHNYFEYFYFPGVPNYIETNRTAELIAGEIQNKSIEKIKIELISEN